MLTLMFVLTNALIVAGAGFVVRKHRMTGYDAWLGAALLTVTQIIVTLIVAGGLLEQFRWPVIAALNLGISALLIGYAVRAERQTGGWLSLDKPAVLPLQADREEGLLRHIWLLGLTAIAVVELGLKALEVYLLPTSDWDSLFYHLATIASWMQTGKIGIVPYALWSNVYPVNAELFYAWLVVFFGHDHYVDGGQALLGLLGAAAVAGIARSVGIGKYPSLAAGLLWLMTPVIVAQLRTNYVDVAFVSLFLVCFYFTIRYLQKPSAFVALLAGCAGGLALGMKSSGVAYIGVLALVMFVHSILLDGAGGRLRNGLRYAALFLAPLAALGGIWYIRTWILYGNPIHPFEVKVLGHVLFAGDGNGSVNERIMVPNTPPELLNKPLWRQMKYAWLQEPSEASYDQRIGGFGKHWPYLLVPSTLLFIGYTLIWKRFVFLALCLPMLIIFLVQPSAWWPRYTLFIVALGAIALAWLMEKIRPLSLKLALQALLIVFVMQSLQSYHQHQTDWGLLRQAWNLPSKDRTVGNLLMPEYRFVDKLPPGTHIAIHFDRFVYPFFGATFQNKVTMMNLELEEGAFLAKIRQSKPDYLFSVIGYESDVFAQKHPKQFRMVEQFDRYRLYQVEHEK